MNALTTTYRHIRRGIELGFYRGQPLIYDGTEPVAIDAQAGKGKFTRFLGVNIISPRTAHLTKILTDPKDAEPGLVNLEDAGAPRLPRSVHQSWPSVRLPFRNLQLQHAALRSDGEA
ncbi:hypothetical protein PSQ19_17515 [Devosia algicola]|uniref:Uncharacterized protein n=1 Tax=Devosia algicola TaxID=3026418 RepID=A0ABY7YME6_9HYPH|nr:hypothetical protein [Devosia algicola]WDR02387.1 hypothetical protein PSQ19_17515 [Devosia algicola]